MPILTRLQSVQIARQAQQHFDAFDRRHRYVVCINSDGTITRVRKIGQQFRAEVRRCEISGY